MTIPTYGTMPLEERKNVSVTLWCHICGRSRTCTDYDEVWGNCACGRRRWATWPKGEQSKGRREQTQRDVCEAEVLARDPICCYPGCHFPSTEVHELQRGQMRASTYLDPAKCLGLCGFLGANHHAWVTTHPIEAHELGLAKWSWET